MSAPQSGFVGFPAASQRRRMTATFSSFTLISNGFGLGLYWV
jgi:hypothetical protein